MLYYRQMALLAKLETTYATDATPTGAANAILASEVSIQPMQGQDLDRNLVQASLGNGGTIAADLHMIVSFRVELAGSGTAGTAPGWDPLIRACGCAATVTASTSVEYNPISSGFESVTIYLNIDGTLFTLLGARGDCNLTVNASGIPVLEFTFTGLWTKPSDQAKPTPDYSSFQKPLVASDVNTPVFTLDGTARVLRNFALNMGNDVQARFLIGAESIVIVDRAETIAAQIEATSIATFDPFAAARDATDLPLVLTHGTAAGSIATLSVPKAQMQRPGNPVEAQGIVEWPLNLRPLPDTGNDQWTLTLT